MTYSNLKNKVMQDKLSSIFDELGVFFAFSDKQFQEGKQKRNIKENEKIAAIQGGGFLPSKNAKSYIKKTNDLMVWLEKQVKKLNPEAVIGYELNNHECYYTGDVSPAYEVLQAYDFTLDQVRAVYHKNYSKQEL